MDEQRLVRDLLDYLSPLLVDAGSYARRVQPRVGRQPAKNGMADSFSAALTDADLSVQNFIEVALLARFPEVSFFGEECDQSLNMKYFPKDGAITVYLDPIDGTRFYQDNLENFNVILTVTNRHEVLGAVCYMPGYDKFFRGEKGAGTTVQSSADVLKGRPGKKADVSKNPLVAVTYDQHELCTRLAPEFSTVFISTAYRPNLACLSINSMLLGESSVIIGGERAGLIDWGALAFLAQEAGAAVSQWDGSPLPRLDALSGLYYSRLLICRDTEVQRRVLPRLGSTVS